MPLFDPLFREHLSSPDQKLAASATVDEFENMSTRVSAWALVEHNEDGTHNVRPSGFDFVPIGGMMLWPGATAPAHWFICDGSQVSRTTYQSLFNVIGTTYGVGDGSTTFNIPDLRQRFPLGKAAAGTGVTLGSTGGSIDHTHTVPALTVPALSVPGLSIPGLSVPGLSYSGNTGGPSATFDPLIFSVTDSAANIVTAAHTHSYSGTTGGGTTGGGTTGTASTGTGSTGTGTSGTNNPPFISMNYIISTGV